MILSSKDLKDYEFDALASHLKQATMFGCKTPNTPRTSSDPRFHEVYNAVVKPKKELTSYEDFSASIAVEQEDEVETVPAIQDVMY